MLNADITRSLDVSTYYKVTLQIVKDFTTINFVHITTIIIGLKGIVFLI